MSNSPTPHAQEEAREPHPCPFCGRMPKVQHKRQGWRVACDNDECPTMPNGFSLETREEAVEAWNTPFSAALSALKEWRESDKELRDEIQGVPVTEAKQAIRAAYQPGARHHEAITALRAAADALKGEG